MTMSTLQREREVVLPVGYADEKGRVHRRALIRKMRGHEEALLYDAALSAGQLVSELIRSCVIRLGDLPALDSSLVTRLYTVDRNYREREQRRGETRAATSGCPYERRDGCDGRRGRTRAVAGRGGPAGPPLENQSVRA